MAFPRFTRLPCLPGFACSRLAFSLLVISLVAAPGCKDNWLLPGGGSTGDDGFGQSSDGFASFDVACGATRPLFCNDSCVDPLTDPIHCGGCGIVCPMGQFCIAGSCQLICPAGQTPCGGLCVTLASDPANCGACGNACPQGQVCSSGMCAATCAPGQTNCNRACTNPQSDNANCGACGVVCPPGQSCQAGQCATTCPQGLTACFGACVSPLSDPSHCGGLRAAPARAASSASPACASSSARRTCPSAAGCAPISTSTRPTAATATPPASRGRCWQQRRVRGLVPAGPHAVRGHLREPADRSVQLRRLRDALRPGTVCSLGQCAVTCAPGLTVCNGVCANLNTDNAHCGDCITTCGPGFAAPPASAPSSPARRG